MLKPAKLYAIATAKYPSSELQSASLENLSGKIEFFPAEVSIYDLDDAVARLQDLHFRAVGAKAVIPLDTEISAEQAKSLFRVGNALMILGNSLLTPEENLQRLDKLVGYAAELGSTSGLESIFFSLMLNTNVDENTSIKADSIIESWKKIPNDKNMGAGLALGVGYSARSGTFNFFNREHYDELLRENPPLRTMQDRFDARNAALGLHFTGQQCKAAFEMFGTIGGAIAASPGGPAMMLGFGGGMGVVGKAAGTISCPGLVREFGTPEPKQESPNTGGAPAATGEVSPNPSTPPVPEPPPAEADEDGCWPNIDKDFGISIDPYGKFARSTAKSLTPTGAGLAAYVLYRNGAAIMPAASSLLSFKALLASAKTNKSSSAFGSHSALQESGVIFSNPGNLTKESNNFKFRSSLFSNSLTKKANFTLAAPSEINPTLNKNSGIWVDAVTASAVVFDENGDPVTDEEGNIVMEEVISSYTLTIPSASNGADTRVITVDPKYLTATLEVLAKDLKYINPSRQ